MTDNVVANPGSGGATFATDYHTASSEHWPITKVGFGTRDSGYTLVDGANGLPVSNGKATTSGSTTITVGGASQTLFGGITPPNGFSIGNPDATNDLWVSDETAAAVNGFGCFRVSNNGGYYSTEVGQKPVGPVSIIGAVTGQKITARYW